MRIVEAVLFSSDKPMRVGEIAKIANLKPEEVSKAMKKLRKHYDERNGAIEIVRIGNKYVMQLKDDYAEYGYKMGKRELTDEELKTLAIIAYYQPITQSELRKLRGSRVYQHVDELKKRGLIYSKVQGRTSVLRTTKRFAEYFGIDASKPEDIKKFFEEKMSKGGVKNE